jgi:hypothetical protein
VRYRIRIYLAVLVGAAVALAGAETAVVEATFIVPASRPPAPATPLRIDDPQPKRCNVT